MTSPTTRYEVVAPAAHIATFERSAEVNALTLEHLLGGTSARKKWRARGRSRGNETR